MRGQDPGLERLEWTAQWGSRTKLAPNIPDISKSAVTGGCSDGKGQRVF